MTVNKDREGNFFKKTNSPQKEEQESWTRKSAVSKSENNKTLSVLPMMPNRYVRMEKNLGPSLSQQPCLWGRGWGSRDMGSKEEGWPDEGALKRKKEKKNKKEKEKEKSRTFFEPRWRVRIVCVFWTESSWWIRCWKASIISFGQSSDNTKHQQRKGTNTWNTRTKQRDQNKKQKKLTCQLEEEQHVRKKALDILLVAVDAESWHSFERRPFPHKYETRY